MDFINRGETFAKTGENKSRTSMLPDDADLHPIFYYRDKHYSRKCIMWLLEQTYICDLGFKLPELSYVRFISLSKENIFDYFSNLHKLLYISLHLYVL